MRDYPETRLHSQQPDVGNQQTTEPTMDPQAERQSPAASLHPSIIARAPNQQPAEKTAEVQRYSFPLLRPVTDEKNRLIESLDLIEVELRHLVVASRKKSMGEQNASIISQIAGISEQTARRLKTRDIIRIADWRQKFHQNALENPAEDMDPDAETQVFRLLCPVVLPDRVINEITLREPDLEAAIMIEKFETENEQLQAMIAALSVESLTIPQISRLKERDVMRMEVWIAPFVSGGLAGADSDA